MTYDSSQQAAMFHTVPAAAGAAAPSSQGALLLSIQQHLTGIYGLDLASSAAREALMRLPVSEAVLRTRAGECGALFTLPLLYGFRVQGLGYRVFK
jgi:hypothetical protein